MSRAPKRRAIFLPAARADLHRLANDDPALPRIALARIRDLETGRVDGVPLGAIAKTGDLGDCRKVYFGAGSTPSHRIVFRALGPAPSARIEIVEIVAVEARADLYAYLLAAVRLGRLPVEARPEYHRVHEEVIRRRRQQRERGG